MIGSELLHTERTTPESYELQKLFRTMADEGCITRPDGDAFRGGGVPRAPLPRRAELFLSLAQD